MYFVGKYLASESNFEEYNFASKFLPSEGE